MKKVLKAIANGFSAVLHGEFLLRLRVDKYFVHILYTFAIFWLMIMMSLMVQKTLVAVEKNKTVLNDLRIYHAQKTVELVEMGRLSTIEDLLEKSGSLLEMPEKPAETIVK